MYISRFILVCKKDSFIEIYAPDMNSTVLVSEEILFLLDTLLNRYGLNPIDETDKDFITIKNCNDYGLLKKHRILTDSLTFLKERYLSFVPKLTIAYLHVTQECNLRCTYCYAQHNLGKGMMMTARNAENYIQKLYNEGVRSFVLTGGEPFLNRDLKKIIDCIKAKKNTTIDLLSNGTLMKGQEDILLKVDKIIVSLDVNKSEQRRGISAEQILFMLTSLSPEIKRKTAVRSVISKGEELLLPDMRKKIESLYLEYISTPRLPNCPEDLCEFPDISLIEDPRELVETLKMVRCGAATSELSIDWNGDVYPCQNLMRKEHYITNLNKSDWYEELQQSCLRNTLLNAHVLNIEKCKECDVRYICGGGCRALSYNVYHCYDHCLEFYCDHFRRYAMQKLESINFKNFKKGEKHEI